MRKRIILLAVCCITLAGWPETVYYVNDFLNNGGGARSMAMGEAMAADPGDRSAALYNPAALLGLSFATLEASHASLFSGTVDYTFVSGVLPISQGKAIGLYMLRSAVDDIWDTRGFEKDEAGRPIYSSDRLRLISNMDYAVALSYAAYWREAFRYGVTAKFIRRRLDKLESFGTALDAGIQYHLSEVVTAGLYARNITASFNRYYADEWEIGLPELFPGLCAKKELPYLYGTLEASFQLVNLLPTSGVAQGPFGGSLDLEDDVPTELQWVKDPVRCLLSTNAGLEYGYRDIFFLRVGTHPLYLFTAGIGLKLGKFTVDSALRRHTELNDSYRVSLAWDFRG